MPDYEKLYHLTFNAMTDALEDLKRLNVGMAQDKLQAAQIQAEALYVFQGGTHGAEGQ